MATQKEPSPEEGKFLFAKQSLLKDLYKLHDDFSNHSTENTIRQDLADTVLDYEPLLVTITEEQGERLVTLILHFNLSLHEKNYQKIVDDIHNLIVFIERL